MIGTTSLDLMECVEMLGMIWNALELLLVWQLHMAPSEKWSWWFWGYRSCVRVWIAQICCLWCVYNIGLNWNDPSLKIRCLLALEVKLRAKERNKRKQVLFYFGVHFHNASTSIYRENLRRGVSILAIGCNLLKG